MKINTIIFQNPFTNVLSRSMTIANEIIKLNSNRSALSYKLMTIPKDYPLFLFYRKRIIYLEQKLDNLIANYADRSNKQVNGIIKIHTGGCACFPICPLVIEDNGTFGIRKCIQTFNKEWKRRTKPQSKLITNAFDQPEWVNLNDPRSKYTDSADKIWVEANKPRPQKHKPTMVEDPKPMQVHCSSLIWEKDPKYFFLNHHITEINLINDRSNVTIVFDNNQTIFLCCDPACKPCKFWWNFIEKHILVVTNNIVASVELYELGNVFQKTITFSAYQPFDPYKIYLHLEKDEQSHTAIAHFIPARILKKVS